LDGLGITVSLANNFMASAKACRNQINQQHLDPYDVGRTQKFTLKNSKKATVKRTGNIVTKTLTNQCQQKTIQRLFHLYGKEWKKNKKKSF